MPCFASLVNELDTLVSSIHRNADGACMDSAVVIPVTRKSTCSEQLIRAVADRLKPVGEGTGDDTPSERWLNVLTSIPYGLCGVHALKHRQSLEGKVWGASLVAVGICAGLFHASKEDSIFPSQARSICRKLDYWMISASTVSLLRACHPITQPPVLLTTLAMIPFEPFKISATNILAMEVEFARRAYGDSKGHKRNDVLKRSFHRQLAAAAVGTLFFFAEDAGDTNIPLVHAGWHCLSAYATAECNTLLKHIETSSC